MKYSAPVIVVWTTCIVCIWIMSKINGSFKMYKFYAVGIATLFTVYMLALYLLR